jgi:DNA primase
MPRISESTIQEVNERMDALAVVGDYVRLENRGGRFWGLCPFHHEKTPSFTVDPDKKFYHCFGCGEGGSIVSFVMNMDKLSYPQAVERIARKTGVEIVYDTASGEAEIRDRKHDDELNDLYERVAKSYYYILKEKPEGAAAREYLAARGVSQAMIERFNLGYAPAGRRWLFAFLTQKGYSEGFLAGSGLFMKKYAASSFFSDRLMFPIRNREGKTVAFGGRLLGGDGPKYLNSSESAIFKKRDNLFALDFALAEIRRTKEVFLVEGYMDVIAMHQAGITNTVAPLGTAFTGDQAKILRRYADRALLFFDRDDAGQSAIEKGIMICTAAGLDCRVVMAEEPHDGAGGSDGTEQNAANMIKSKDPSEILLKKGPEHLIKITKYSMLPLQFLITRSRSIYDISDPGKKRKAIESLFPYVKTIESELTRSDTLLSIADAFFCDDTALANDYKGWLAGASRSFSHEEKKNTESAPIRLADELFLLTTVAANMESHPEFLSELRSVLSVEEIRDANAKELYIAIEEWQRDGQEGGFAGIFSHIRPEPLRSFVMEKCGGNEFSFDAVRLFEESLHSLRRQRLEARRRLIVQRLRLLGGHAGKEGEDLLEDKIYIDRELQTHRQKAPHQIPAFSKSV